MPMANGAPFYREDPGVSLISLPDFDDACIALLDNAMAGETSTATAPSQPPPAASASAVSTPVARSNAATPTTADALDWGGSGAGRFDEDVDGEAEWDVDDVVGIRESIAADDDGEV
jgi:hypothetical protein